MFMPTTDKSATIVNQMSSHIGTAVLFVSKPDAAEKYPTNDVKM